MVRLCLQYQFYKIAFTGVCEGGYLTAMKVLVT